MFLSLVPFFVSILCNILLVTSLNDEGTALLTFKKSIKQDPLGSLNNWNNYDTYPCNWNGITCKNQRVVSLSIPNSKLSGFLSSSLGSLSELRHVNLRSNKFYGALPSELFKARGLQSLVLYENLLSGPLPFEVGNLQYLQALDLSHNFFNGSLPTSLVQCRRLRNLDFSHNNLSGPLSDDFGEKLHLLEKLDLSYNEFSGSIPGDLSNLSSLQATLDLSHNMFNGSIPPSLGDLPEKVYIDLTYNNLSGPIPQNGALINRGPTAFIGNNDLCGPPLKSLCSPNGETNSYASFPYLPSNSPPPDRKNVGGHRLSKASIIAIIVCDLIGICVIGLLFSYCYSRVHSCKSGGRCKKKCSCFRKDESGTLSENAEQYDLVSLEGQLAFDLNELLKASAFVLGKSGIGILYRVVLEDGQTLAVRRLGEGGSQRFKEFQTEVEAIGKLRHRNIVTFRAYYWSLDEKLLVYDFVPNGNLATAIHGKPDFATFNPLSWSARLKIMKGVAKGLIYLHEYSPKKYVHGNLKPTNVLLGDDMEPKISDFGLARLANITDGGSPTFRSNRTAFENQPQSSGALEAPTFASYYQAPEVLKAMKPSQKWDVYSFGVMLLEIVTGRPAMVLVGSLEMELVKWVELCVNERKPISDVLDPHLVVRLDERDGKEEEQIVAVLKIGMVCVQSGPERRPLMRHVLDALERVRVSMVEN